MVKLLLISIISTEGAKFATANISNFYLMMPLKRPEIGRVKMLDIPEEMITEYELHKLQQQMGGSTFGSFEACTAYLKWKPTASMNMRRDSTKKDTTKAPSPQPLEAQDLTHTVRLDRRRFWY